MSRSGGAALVIAAAALLTSTLSFETPAIANSAVFSLDRAKLERGEEIAFPSTADIAGKHYVGGVSYAIIDATPDELMGILEDAAAWESVLPKTKYATRVTSGPNDERVELHQGNALVDATYTLHLVRDVHEQKIKFWLDLNRPHTIEDAWGYFRYQVVSTPGEPSRLLVTYGALVDVGPGMLRSLYENRVHAAMMTVPNRLRAYVQLQANKRIAHA
ncbi:MAG: hypothetical protein ABI461_12035 [Polyangiaceae bacterium]